MESKFFFIQETFEFLNIFHSHGFPKLSDSRPHKICSTQSHQKNRFLIETYQGAKPSLQQLLSSHRNYESLPFYFCHEIPSSRLPKGSSVPPRSSNRRSHTSRIHQNFFQNANCDCILAVYGYVRGTNLW